MKYINVFIALFFGVAMLWLFEVLGLGQKLFTA